MNGGSTHGARSLETELLAHAAWMRALARRLAADDARADDAAQEAALAALEQRAATRRPRAWLAAVVGNAVRRLARAEERRARREARASRPEALPSAAELAAEAEMQHALVAELLALGEPYRSTLVLRFYRGLEPAEIARLAGVPAGTVRSRLSRGLELLRARLDARAGGRSAWTALVAPLATRPQAPSAAASAAWIAGGIAMGLKATLACAGALVVAGAAYFVFRGEPELPDAALMSAAEPAESALAIATQKAETGAPVGLAPGGLTDKRVAAPDAAAPRKSARSARVVARERDGKPFAGALVSLSAFGRDEPVLAVARTNAEGRAELELPSELGERARIAWSAAGIIDGSRDCDDLSGELELRILYATALFGVVSDAETGMPLEGALFVEHGVRSGPDGRYRLEGLKRGQPGMLHVRREGYVESEVRYLVNEPEGELNIALERGFALELFVYDRESGHALPGAVLAAYKGGPAVATTDEGGRASVRTAVGRELGLYVSAEGYCALRWVWNVQAAPKAPEEALVRVPLPRVAAIEGRVVDSEGEPPLGAWVRSRCADERAGLHRIPDEQARALGLLSYAGYETPIPEENTDIQGRYRLEVVPCAELRTVRAGHPDFPVRDSVLGKPLAPGETIALDFELTPGGTLQGHVLENDAPWSAAEVGWKDAAGRLSGTVFTDEDGRYRLQSVAPGVVSVLLFEGPLRAVVDQREVTIEAGETVEVDFTRALEHAAISGLVRESGAPVPNMVVVASPVGDGGGRRVNGTRTGADGAYRIEVPAGLVFDVRTGHSQAMRRLKDIPAGATDVDFDLPALGKLRLRFVDAATGEPLRLRSPAVFSLLWRSSGAASFEEESPVLDVDGRQDLNVVAGEVDVLVHFAKEGYAPREATGIPVPPGGESEIVTLALERALAARLAFTGDGVTPLDLRDHLLFAIEEAQLGSIEGPFAEPDARANNRIDGIWMRLDRQTLLLQMLEVDSEGNARVPGLAPGRYHLRAYPDDFTFEPAAFELSAANEEPIAVRWKRR